MTELRIEAYEIPAADLGEENPLPVFREKNENMDVQIQKGADPEEGKHLGWKISRRILPYRLQDGYNRKRVLRRFQSVVLENQHLKATVLPELGGRLVSLFHKSSKRELLERNPVFQPANLSLRNAWFSGGIEWNTPQFGHSHLTCSPVYAAQATGIKGEPVLRLYEWDRLKGVPWQIDLHLPPDSEFLYAHIRVINPHEFEIPMYWWTNIAVPEKPDVRVLVPADTTFAHYNLPSEPVLLEVLPMPLEKGVDLTYTSRLPSSREFYTRISKDQRPWVAAVDGEGKGLFQISTKRLKGRKLFAWGTSPGCRRWQEFLSVPNTSGYLEIQAGLAQTQLESLPMPANTEWNWTEAFGLLHVDPKKAHSTNWQEAWRIADANLITSIPTEALEQKHRSFCDLHSTSPSKILHQGSGWGALERHQLKKQEKPDRIPSEFLFPQESMGEEQHLWIQLLETGSFPDQDPQKNPGAWMIQSDWQALLEKSVQTQKQNHWLAWLHLGVMHLENLDEEAARQAWEKSLQCKASGWARRNLAFLAHRHGNTEEACEQFKQAWEIGPKILPLAHEFGSLLVELKKWNEFNFLTKNIPDTIAKHERILILKAKAGIEQEQFEGLDEFFRHEFTEIREGTNPLTDLWFTYHERKAAKQEGVPITLEFKRRIRKDFSPPQHIDFRMTSSLE